MKSYFRRLQQKWQVNATDLALILIVFALTGTTTAWLTRYITAWLGLERNQTGYWISKIGMLLFGYQALILLFSIPFGQFPFFWRYEKKILYGIFGVRTGKNPTVARMPRLNPLALPSMQQIAIFASGAGSNADQIIRYFSNHPFIKVSLVVSNKPEAGVLDIARKAGIPVLLLDKETFFRGGGYVNELKEAGIDFIVLAGFLWKIPTTLVEAYRNRMINIHPALLPGYGGKGMYGNRVHEAVIAAGENQSGISIHYVDEVFDHGEIIFQATCPVEAGDTPESLAARIHGLEHANYPRVIEELLTAKSTLNTGAPKPHSSRLP